MHLLPWFDYACLPEAELARVDVAHMNMACAAGLPGAEHQDPDLCERSLRGMAAVTRQATNKGFAGFRRNPTNYDGSEGKYRAATLVNALQSGCEVRYNPKIWDESVPMATADSFIFGIIQGDGGSCASLPVLYAAVGRRLGYPMKIVANHLHLFARWDDPNDTFNIEGTNRGMSDYPDDHYRTGRFALRAGHEELAGFMRSLTPRRELAAFLKERAVCWREAGYWREATECYAWAAELDGFPAMTRCFQLHLDLWEDRLLRLAPAARVWMTAHPVGRRFSSLPKELEDTLTRLSVLEGWLTDPELDRKWWAPMRADPAFVPRDLPATLATEFSDVLRFDNGRIRKVRLDHV